MTTDHPTPATHDSEAMGSPSERNEYGIYLGVFLILSILLLVLWFFETNSLVNQHASTSDSSSGTDTANATSSFFRTAVFTLALATSLICGAFAPDRYFLATKPKDSTEKVIPLRRKKIALVVAFCTYLAALMMLTMWAGAAVSSYSSLLVITGALSVYVANTPHMRLFIAFAAISTYSLTAIYYCPTTTSAPSLHFTRSAAVNIGVTIATVLISYMATRLQRESRSEEAHK